jgi:hypothetical protein
MVHHEPVSRFAPMMRAASVLSLLIVLLNLLAIATLSQRAMGREAGALSSITVCLGLGKGEGQPDKADAPVSAPMSIMCAHCLPIADGAYVPPANEHFAASARDALLYVAYAMPVEHFDRSAPPEIASRPRAPPRA